MGWISDTAALERKKLERSLWHWCRQVDWCKAVDMLYACIRLRIFWILLPRLSKSKTSLVRLKLIRPSHEFRRKIVDFATFFFVNTFGFRHTTIHLKTPLFNPLATQQLHRIRNLSAVRWITYHFTTHKKIYIFWTYCKICRKFLIKNSVLAQHVLYFIRMLFGHVFIGAIFNSRL